MGPLMPLIAIPESTGHNHPLNGDLVVTTYDGALEYFRLREE